MDGLYRVAPSPVLFPVGGSLWRLHPLTFGALASCEAFLLLRRRHPLRQVAELAQRRRTPENVIRDLAEKARAEMRADKSMRCVTAEDLLDWLYTVEGVMHSSYWCLEPSGCPEFATPEKSFAYVEKNVNEFAAEFIRARDLVSGTDILASLDWKDSPDDDKPAKKRFYPWRRIIRYLGMEYHFSDAELARMTLYTFRTYVTDESELGGTATVGVDEMRKRGLARPRRPVPTGGSHNGE